MRIEDKKILDNIIQNSMDNIEKYSCNNVDASTLTYHTNEYELKINFNGLFIYVELRIYNKVTYYKTISIFNTYYNKFKNIRKKFKNREKDKLYKNVINFVNSKKFIDIKTIRTIKIHKINEK